MKTNMKLEQTLNEIPLSRERKYRWQVITNQIYHDFPQLAAENIDKRLLKHIAQKAVTYDRQLRKLQQDNPHLQGEDYNDKKMLEQEAQIALGYEAGHERKVKELKKL